LSLANMPPLKRLKPVRTTANWATEKARLGTTNIITSKLSIYIHMHRRYQKITSKDHTCCSLRNERIGAILST
jgi:hypothetical protein